MDKTGFQIGCRKTQLVVTIDSNKLFYVINPENRDYNTLVKYISFAGKTIPPMLLVSKVNILHKRCQHNNLNSDIVIGITKTGYTNDNTALKWL